jgi:hypothetical protein
VGFAPPNGDSSAWAGFELAIANFQAGREGTVSTPINVVIRAKFNPNLYANWFSSVMQVVNNIHAGGDPDRRGAHPGA